jgi:choline transporter-like protein 2/4/5
VEQDDASSYMMFAMFFGFVWIVSFLMALEQFIIAAVTCLWYFSGEGSDDSKSRGTVEVSLAAKWAFLYHMGSIALGSFIVAVIQILKAMVEKAAKKQERLGDNPAAKAAMCCLRCCVHMLDQYVKYINKNVYIQIALHNSSFCSAAKESFFLIIRHIGRFSSIGLVGKLLNTVGKAIIVGLSLWLTWVFVQSSYP